MKISAFTVLTPPKILCTSVLCAIHDLTEYYSHFGCEHVYFNAMTLCSLASSVPRFRSQPIVFVWSARRNRLILKIDFIWARHEAWAGKWIIYRCCLSMSWVANERNSLRSVLEFAPRRNLKVSLIRKRQRRLYMYRDTSQSECERFSSWNC